MNWMKLYLKLLSLLLGSMIIVCLIPSDWIKASIDISTHVLSQEGLYPTSGNALRPIVLDNFTDSLMLNTAYSVDSSNPLRSALQSVYSVPIDTTNKNDQILSLNGLVKGSNVEKITYDRYWHGYLTYLRPLLILFDYSKIRLFLSITLILSLCFLIYLTWKKVGLTEALCLFLGFMSVDLFSISKSMQFSGVFLIAILASVYWIKHKSLETSSLFFVVGGLTSFVDLLSAPLVSLELLLIVGALYYQRNRLKQLFISCWFWFSGYLSIWISKWILSQALFTKGSILTAIDQIRNRTVGIPDDSFSRLLTIKINLFQLIGYSRMSKVLFLTLFVIAVSVILKNIKRINFKRDSYWLVVILIPYFWYLVAANHSYLHVWYTYRTQFGAVVGGLLFVTDLLKNSPNRKKEIT